MTHVQLIRRKKSTADVLKSPKCRSLWKSIKRSNGDVGIVTDSSKKWPCLHMRSENMK